MSSNNMENPNGDGANSNKRQCPEGYASKNEHSRQPKVTKPKLEAEDDNEDVAKKFNGLVMSVKPDSRRQRLGPKIGSFKESVKGKNPSADLNKEGHCSKGNVSMHENRAESKVNFSRLETESLRRYCRYYKIRGISSESSREQMLNAVQHHFDSHPPLNEEHLIPKFINALQRRRKDKRPED